MGTIERLKHVLEFNARQVIDEDPLHVDAVGGQEHHVFDAVASAHRLEVFRGFTGYRVYRGYQAKGAVSHG